MQGKTARVLLRPLLMCPVFVAKQTLAGPSSDRLVPTAEVAGAQPRTFKIEQAAIQIDGHLHNIILKPSTYIGVTQ